MSGGPDSLALLLLAEAAFPGMVEAATVDHGLRPESADEARFVAGLCRDRGIEHTILTCAVADGNLQDRARSARYAALDQWAKGRELAAIATAHHADDQAETVLMRLNRGSGLSGLSGIRASTCIPGSDTLLLRPLLGWRRAELAQIVAAAGVTPVRDPSNDDPRFDRVRMRSALRNAAWIDPAALARSAEHMAEAEALVGACVDREWVDNVRQEDAAIHYQPTAPTLIRKRVAQKIVAALGGQTDLSQIAELVDRLEAGQGGNLAGVMVRPRSGVWIFEPEPPRRA
ncbi:hypothetical protein GCM10022600_09500 [Qipengyuania pelagi]|uniref:tRNA lysidine(34) synthetase TilS n=1 Tax=Qipengyuania pelagi TaxID=994320 RepID=UPI002FEBAC27